MESFTIGRYQVTAEIGQGGMAAVYRAYDPQFDREVAIKVLPREFLHSPAFKARFQREARVLGSLEHSAIVPVYDFGEQDGQPFLVMRLMTGGSLEDRLCAGRMLLPEATRIVAYLAPALDEAHARGVVHRDLKPSNILFDPQGKPYLADFGIALLAQGTRLTSQFATVGTPAYMSPEQGRGDPDVDGSSDIYSLGVMLFEMLSGRVPYESDSPTGQILKHITAPIPDILALCPDLPADSQVLIERVLAKEKTARYPSGHALVQALIALCDCQPLPSETDPVDAVQQEPGANPAAPDEYWRWTVARGQQPATIPNQTTAKAVSVSPAAGGMPAPTEVWRQALADRKNGRRTPAQTSGNASKTRLPARLWVASSLSLMILLAVAILVIVLVLK